ncbi:homoserine dehydrogenase [Pontibacillus salipaludis]|uniref:Homoserine dehydrogenase n=1 Tax=Pontibacillus salipaludis TaxID=1697394 RepID=A0ABQ1QB72_9BACI|nr:homoserine dehydrogenase [Pontibacillus salipaludis]GGD21782.1 homoserine dehydrogenase [Pontibacillus salipaludis]
MTIRIGLLGYGTVGKGVIEIIHSHQERIQALLGEPVEVTGVLVQHLKKKREIPSSILVTSDFDRLLLQDIDIVLEAIVGEEPSFTYCKKAIEQGKHVVTANKEMYAIHGKELKELASKHSVSVGYESTTVAGTPVIRTLQQLLQVNQVEKVEGILNGTSNFILTKMRQDGTSFEQSLKEAQQKGYAEADPTNDIKGYDAFYKLMNISELLYGKQPNWDDVYVEGIDRVDPTQILEASFMDKKIKHVATIEWKDGDVRASIQPISLTEHHPLYSIDGVQNGVVIHTDLAGPLTLSGPGAGASSTASGMIEDFITIFQQSYNNVHQFQ